MYPRLAALPAHSSSSSPVTKRGNAGRRKMSSYTSSSQLKWPQYGPLPITLYPKCSAPLKRKTCQSDTNGHRGRDYLKCLNEARKVAGEVRSKFSHCCLLRFLPISFLFRRIWDLGFMLPFSDPEGMQPFRLGR